MAHFLKKVRSEWDTFDRMIDVHFHTHLSRFPDHSSMGAGIMTQLRKHGAGSRVCALEIPAE